MEFKSDYLLLKFQLQKQLNLLTSRKKKICEKADLPYHQSLLHQMQMMDERINHLKNQLNQLGVFN